MRFGTQPLSFATPLSPLPLALHINWIFAAWVNTLLYSIKKNVCPLKKSVIIKKNVCPIKHTHYRSYLTRPINHTRAGPIDHTRTGPLDRPRPRPLDHTRRSPIEHARRGPTDNTRPGPIIIITNKINIKAKTPYIITWYIYIAI